MKTPIIAVALLLSGLPAHAEEDAATRADRWHDLQHAVFGDRMVSDGAGVIALQAPDRAQDASLVPITVTVAAPGATPADRVTTVYIMVDGNPSPLAGTFHFGPAADPRSLKTRVRVDQYSLMHAVAETEDGRLFAAERFVKAAGGCSAPSLKDPKIAMSRMGKMRLRVDDATPIEDGTPAVAQLLISHPNSNGMQVDQLTHNFVPPRFIQDVAVHYGGQLVFKVDADISLSEDPAITFGFIPRGPGPFKVDVQDSTQAVFSQEFPVAPGRS